MTAKLVGEQREVFASLRGGVIELETRRETVYDNSGWRGVVRGVNKVEARNLPTREAAEKAAKDLAVTVAEELLVEAQALRGQV